MRRNKKDDVSVSFHLIRRSSRDADDKRILKGFSTVEFDELVERLLRSKEPDLKSQEEIDLLRFRNNARIVSCRRLESGIVFGSFKGSYWGHAFQNSVLGLVPSHSINLRPFYFLMYQSRNGYIYVGSQYLGNYGNYTGLKNEIFAAFSDKTGLDSSSLRQDNEEFNDAVASQVDIVLSRAPRDIAGKRSARSMTVISLRKTKDNDLFDAEVSRPVLSAFGRGKDYVKNELAKVFSQGVIEINDNDIEDCKVIATKNGKTQTLYMFDEGGFATKYLLPVPLDEHGHPIEEPTMNAMIEALRKKVLHNVTD